MTYIKGGDFIEIEPTQQETLNIFVGSLDPSELIEPFGFEHQRLPKIVTYC